MNDEYILFFSREFLFWLRVVGIAVVAGAFSSFAFKFFNSIFKFWGKMNNKEKRHSRQEMLKIIKKLSCDCCKKEIDKIDDSLNDEEYMDKVDALFVQLLKNKKTLIKDQSKQDKGIII